MCCRLMCAFVLALILAAAPPQVKAQSQSFRLSAPDNLAATGFLKHILPRFSLKHGVRIELVPEGAEAEARLTASGSGVPVFSGLGKKWVLSQPDPGNDHVTRFEDWLTSDVGKRTIDAFQPDGTPLFTAAAGRPEDTEVLVVAGDAAKGEKLAVRHCGRCHIVNNATRMTSIGSTPSFAVMRGFSDWQDRFEAFFSLNPHPSFTVIEGVTQPFSANRPPPIVPLELTMNELDAILAFVSQIQPADLGAPIQYQ